MIRFLVPFHVHIFCLAFFVRNHFEFSFQSFWHLYNIGYSLNVVDKCIKPMLAGNFQFIFYFYWPLKPCNFKYSNLLLLINNSVGIRHCNHQPFSHISGSYLLKLKDYIKAKCLYEVILFLYSIGYLDHSVHSPHLPFLREDWTFNQIFKNEDMAGL